MSKWNENPWSPGVQPLFWNGGSTTIKEMTTRNNVRVFRRAYIKRRQLSDGLFEADWYEITSDVKRWGSINNEIDFQRYGRLQFSELKLVVQNIEGRYNPDDNVASLWNGYVNQQRTLVKIEAGFRNIKTTDSGIKIVEEYPSDPTVFVGIISGDISVSDRNEVTLNIAPLSQVFRDFPASELTGFDDSVTASKFMTLLRDQTDGSGNFIFRPFFQDTTTNWEITATSFIYSNLNTSTAADLSQLDTWKVIERLSQAENYIPYITPTGKFRFVPKTVGATSTYDFVGLSVKPNRTSGRTIKNIFRYGKKLTQFYSRVSVKFLKDDTNTSFAVTGLAFAINGTNTAWKLGHRTFSIENFWMDSATANSIAAAVFAEISALDEEINFSTSFIPHLNLLDRVTVSHDPTELRDISSLWDLNNWDTELTWDAERGDAILLETEPFKILSINLNLDNFESRFVLRQLNE